MPYYLWAVERELKVNPSDDNTVVLQQPVKLRSGHRQFVCYGATVDYHLTRFGVSFEIENCFDNVDHGTHICFPLLKSERNTVQANDLIYAEQLSSLKNAYLDRLGFRVFGDKYGFPEPLIQIFNTRRAVVSEFVWKKIEDPVIN